MLILLLEMVGNTNNATTTTTTTTAAGRKTMLSSNDPLVPTHTTRTTTTITTMNQRPQRQRQRRKPTCEDRCNAFERGSNCSRSNWARRSFRSSKSWTRLQRRRLLKLIPRRKEPRIVGEEIRVPTGEISLVCYTTNRLQECVVARSGTLDSIIIFSLPAMRIDSSTRTRITPIRLPTNKTHLLQRCWNGSGLPGCNHFPAVQ
mmetsp:Transcript_11521/g.31904  ORF Transcript_11521/g.31904 Transcript_11521/m.31904 type:complete len:203 (-) Transcript_11521:1145-1753(-)